MKYYTLTAALSVLSMLTVSALLLYRERTAWWHKWHDDYMEDMRVGVMIRCEETDCNNRRSKGSLWCEEHQPRKPDVRTLEDRLL